MNGDLNLAKLRADTVAAVESMISAAAALALDETAGGDVSSDAAPSSGSEN